MKNKIIALSLITLTVFTFSSCREKVVESDVKPFVGKEITIYNVFDNEDIFTPIIQKFSAEYGSIKVNYRKFNDLAEYKETIINELAEGQGPDIFFMHNSWFYQDYKKLLPAPEGVSIENFKDTYVDVTANDVIITGDDGVSRIYSFPLFVDTLALYYNRTHFSSELPEKGKPAETWPELEEEIYRLKTEDNSFERFKIAGIALGYANNIHRAMDILLTLMLQNGTNIYSEDYKTADFANSQGLTSFGQPKTPGLDALKFYTSFGLPQDRNYTWNDVISDQNSIEKEIASFVKGKVSMIFGYSYLYNEILRQIEIQSKQFGSTIDIGEVRTAPMPQTVSSISDISSKATLASYFAPVVSRTTTEADTAWQFISFLTNRENSQYYIDKTKRPTARRDLISNQESDPIYGVFTSQVGIAKTIPMPKPERFEEIFIEMIDSVIKTVPHNVALKNAQDKINELIPPEGLFPQYAKILQSN